MANLRRMMRQRPRIDAEQALPLFKTLIGMSQSDISVIIKSFNDIDFVDTDTNPFALFKETLNREFGDKLAIQDVRTLFDVICLGLSRLRPDSALNDDDINKMLSRLNVPYDNAAVPVYANIVSNTYTISNYYAYEQIEDYKSIGPDKLAVSCCVEIRAVFDNPFAYSKDSSAVDYNPELLTGVPLVILEVESSIFDETRCYQLDEQSLDSLINTLLASQKQLLKLKAAWESKQ